MRGIKTANTVPPELAEQVRRFARESGVKVDRVLPTGHLGKAGLGLGKGGLQSEQVTDSVLVEGRDSHGVRHLYAYHVDVDPESSRRLHGESLVLTGIGAGLPIVGPFVAMAASLNHLAHLAPTIAKQKAQHGHVDPHKRAELDTAIKHLVLSVVSAASGGLAHHAEALAEVAHSAHEAVQLTEATSMGTNALGHRDLRPPAIARALWQSVQGAFAVAHHDHGPANYRDCRITLVKVTDPPPSGKSARSKSRTVQPAGIAASRSFEGMLEALVESAHHGHRPTSKMYRFDVKKLSHEQAKHLIETLRGVITPVEGKSPHAEHLAGVKALVGELTTYARGPESREVRSLARDLLAEILTPERAAKVAAQRGGAEALPQQESSGGGK